VSEEFTRELIEVMAKSDAPNAWERLARYALTLLDRAEEERGEKHRAQRDASDWNIKYHDANAQLTAARKVVEAVRELRTVGQGKIQWVEILDRIDDLIDAYDKVVKE